MNHENPFSILGKWYWWDENHNVHGPYATQAEALYDLLYHLAPPWYTQWWNTVKEIWRDSRG